MPFFTMSLRRALQASILFLATTTSAQSCFYPDGTPSPDSPCSSGAGHSSCCNSDSFCLDNGLCYGGGIVSRGSCTDETWGSDACAGFCKTERPSAGIAITPCADHGGENSTFTCGLDNAGCRNKDKVWTLGGLAAIALRPSQIAELAPTRPAMESSIMDSQTTTSSVPTTNGTTMYTAGQMAGLGCGLGLPLTFFLVVALCMLHKEKQKHTGPKLMYKLPDNHQEFISQLPNRPNNTMLRAHSNYSIDSRPGVYSSHGLERENSVLTLDSTRPAQEHSFLDRYNSIKSNIDANRASRIIVHEMDGVSPHEPVVRFELSDKRFSTPTGN